MLYVIDDFGSSSQSNAKIIQLVTSSIFFNGVSCIVTNINNDAMLKQFFKLSQTYIDVGLHLTFTDFKFLIDDQQMPKNTHFFKCHINPKYKTIYKEIELQFHKFENIFKKMPSYIDSHHHIHQSPLYAFALTNFLRNNPKYTQSPGFYVRKSNVPIMTQFNSLIKCKEVFWKNFLLSIYSIPINFLLKKYNIPSSDALFGSYNLTDSNYNKIFHFYQNESKKTRLKKIVYFCHPGEIEDDLTYQKTCFFKKNEYIYFHEITNNHEFKFKN